MQFIYNEAHHSSGQNNLFDWNPTSRISIHSFLPSLAYYDNCHEPFPSTLQQIIENNFRAPLKYQTSTTKKCKIIKPVWITHTAHFPPRHTHHPDLELKHYTFIFFPPHVQLLEKLSKNTMGESFPKILQQINSYLGWATIILVISLSYKQKNDKIECIFPSFSMQLLTSFKCDSLLIYIYCF